MFPGRINNGTAVNVRHMQKYAKNDGLPQSPMFAYTQGVAILTRGGFLGCKFAILDPNDMPSLKEDVAVTMSMLEIHMPPSFFDVMSHLVLHLVEELELCGPVHTRWMYGVERMNKVLKGYVNNMARPEACMAKSHVLDEAIGLVAEFMAKEYEPLHHKVWTEEAAAGTVGEVLQGASTTTLITPSMRDIAHEYMLLNRTSFLPLCREYVATRAQFEAAVQSEIPVAIFPSLATWVREAVRKLGRGGELGGDADMKKLSVPPKLVTKLYSRMEAYGNHYKCDDGSSAGMVSYDCGVASILSAQGSTSREVLGQIHYVGVLKRIRVMDYGEVTKRIALMECDWVRHGVDANGEPAYKRDEAGFLLANFSCMLEQPHDSFVLPSLVQQVFYAHTDESGPWRVVLHSEPRTRRSQISDYDEFINMRVCVPSLEDDALMSPTSNIPNMVGAITFSERDVELAMAPLLRGDIGNISDED